MDNKNKQILRDDINFLEYPNWIISERNESKTLIMERENGRYIASTTDSVDKLPDRMDKILLYYLLHVIIPAKENKLVTTRYNILKNAFGSTSRQYYERILESFDRWAAIYIKFEGVFYEGDGYTTRGFHILDGYKLNKDGKLEIYFNEQYLEQLRNTNYFKLINFDEYKLLKRPTSARLYEILIKTFKDRDEWQIGIIKLGEKLTLSEKYPSQILKKLIPAVNEINGSEEIELKINFDYNKQTHLCTFKKVKPTEDTNSQDTPQQTPDPQNDNLTALIQLLPKEHQDKKTISDALKKAHHKHGFAYVARNIRYTNSKCKGNYRAYLNKALKADWGLSLKEDEEVKQKTIDRQQKQRQQEHEAFERQKQMRSQAQDYMQTLSSEELQSMREEADSRLDEKIKKSAQKIGNYDEIIDMIMVDIVQERLSAAL